MTYPKNVTVWDLETSGLDPFIHKPIEVAWVVTKNNLVVKARRYFLNYQIDIPEEAIRIHGITRQAIEESEDATRDPQDVLRELLGDILASEGHVTHNGTNFDLVFLRQCLSSPISEEHLRETHVDTAAIFKGRGLRISRTSAESLDSYAKRVLRIRSTFKYNLRIACKTHDIPVSNTHRAMDDVMLTQALYSKMCLKV